MRKSSRKPVSPFAYMTSLERAVAELLSTAGRALSLDEIHEAVKATDGGCGPGIIWPISTVRDLALASLTTWGLASEVDGAWSMVAA